MTTKDTLAALLKWPTESADVTVDVMLRVTGAETQRIYLDKMAAMETQGPKLADPLYRARTDAVISGVCLMLCLREFRDAAPDKARTCAAHMWELCEDGGEFGPALWEWLEAAGLDPELIESARKVDAVDPVGGVTTE